MALVKLDNQWARAYRYPSLKRLSHSHTAIVTILGVNIIVISVQHPSAQFYKSAVAFNKFIRGKENLSWFFLPLMNMVSPLCSWSCHILPSTSTVYAYSILFEWRYNVYKLWMMYHLKASDIQTKNIDDQTSTHKPKVLIPVIKSSGESTCSYGKDTVSGWCFNAVKDKYRPVQVWHDHSIAPSKVEGGIHRTWYTLSWASRSTRSQNSCINVSNFEL